MSKQAAVESLQRAVPLGKVFASFIHWHAMNLGAILRSVESDTSRRVSISVEDLASAYAKAMQAFQTHLWEFRTIAGVDYSGDFAEAIKLDPDCGPKLYEALAVEAQVRDMIQKLLILQQGAAALKLAVGLAAASNSRGF